MSTSDVDPRRRAISVEEAVSQLGIGRSLAYEMVREGTLRTVRAGHRILVPISSLEEFLAGPAESEVNSPETSTN